MEIAALGGLTAAFEDWRSKKRHAREAVPADLLERARQATRRHGPAAVARATKVDRSRLRIGSNGRHRRGAATAKAPTFSRVELAAPAAVARPFAEVETAAGLKVRLFTQTTEALGLLSSLLGAGGVR